MVNARLRKPSQDRPNPLVADFGGERPASVLRIRRRVGGAPGAPGAVGPQRRSAADRGRPWMDALLGAELWLPLKFLLAVAIVLALIGAAAYLVRRFGAGAMSGAAQRGRQPRLAVVDSVPLDNRRKLGIVRRDNVEHLLLIGDTTDVLIEPNIVRASPAQPVREARAGAPEPVVAPPPPSGARPALAPGRATRGE